MVPTKKTRILPSEEAPRLTTDILSLVINTTPIRINVPNVAIEEELPKVIKRNSIVPPHSASHISWSVPGSFSVSSVTTSPNIHSSTCPTETTASILLPSRNTEQAELQNCCKEIGEPLQGNCSENQTCVPHSSSEALVCSSSVLSGTSGTCEYKDTDLLCSDGTDETKNIGLEMATIINSNNEFTNDIKAASSPIVKIKTIATPGFYDQNLIEGKDKHGKYLSNLSSRH